MYEPYFCPKGRDPFDLVEWKFVDAVILDQDKNTIFEQKNVEAPVFWSDRAVRVVAQKYFRGRLGTETRETSVRQLIGRVVSRIYEWTVAQGYFHSANDAQAFCNDLCWLLLHQYGSFNSPVWFNLGVDTVPQQCSACFIQSVQDNMVSIAELQRDETMVFKRGSGSGTNFSTLRSHKEFLSGGGRPSGPVSFMKGLDAWAGITKSGGTTRRAAKMNILNVGHPDILEFIDSKHVEERKAHTLIKAGYSKDFDDPQGAYASVFFQNANHSVRVNDAFMKKVVYALAHPDEEVLWELKAITTGDIIDRVPVLTVWNKICEAAWQCGDPGLQFDTTTNAWHTCPADGRINGSNPCSEYVFLDDTSCNLASLNLLKFRRQDGTFDDEAFTRATIVFITAQEALVSKAHYPTDKLAKITKRYRTLGLGYTNLGAYLMTAGLAYDSDAGRKEAAEITALMTAQAYLTSAKLAQAVGPFDAYEPNQAAMLAVIEKHTETARQRGLDAAQRWEDALAAGRQYGFRNAQVTVLAPTGTISFMMDADTTGCEPEASLYKVKKLVGGGALVLDNRLIEPALTRLGYTSEQRGPMLAWLQEHQTIEGAPGLKETHLPVFDCAIPSAGQRMLSFDAHLKMVAAIQPFLSGAISKTVNVPNQTTKVEMGKAYIQAWKMGIKNVSVYRDGCKKSQPLETTMRDDVPTPVRRKLRDHQNNMHRLKFRFGNIKGYMLVTPFEDTGMPGEVFVQLSKEGSTISGLVDGWAQAISYCLQYGVTLETLVHKFSHTKFEPSGFSPDTDIRFASSIYDALMRKLGAVFLKAPTDPIEVRPANNPYNGHAPQEELQPNHRLDALDCPPCDVCGALMGRNGSNCYVCHSCGTSSGCS